MRPRSPVDPRKGTWSASPAPWTRGGSVVESAAEVVGRTVGRVVGAVEAIAGRGTSAIAGRGGAERARGGQRKAEGDGAGAKTRSQSAADDRPDTKRARGRGANTKR